jgi:hypothetical protein
MANPAWWLPAPLAASATSRRQAWSGMAEMACYSSNAFCGPIQGEMKIEVRSPKSRVRSPESGVQSPKSKVRGARGGVGCSEERWPATLDLLSRLLIGWVALGVLVIGCAGPRPLKGARPCLLPLEKLDIALPPDKLAAMNRAQTDAPSRLSPADWFGLAQNVSLPFGTAAGLTVPAVTGGI